MRNLTLKYYNTMANTFRITETDYIKANRKGSREAELEFSTGFKSTHRIHTNKKTYSRKKENKNYW